jgi:hypothetical protein
MMIKTIATPQQNTYNIAIPNQYIGKKLEIIMYALDEITEAPIPTVLMADFWGTLSDEAANDLQVVTKEGRNDWEKAINQ